MWRLLKSVGPGTTDLPHPYWISNSTSSKWISHHDGFNIPGGTFTYRIAFNLTGYDLTTAFINMNYALDNNLLSIDLNGVNMGLSGGSYSNWTNGAINSGFAVGLNNLDFTVYGDGTTDGFRAEFLSYGADELPDPGTVTPEPVTMVLLGSGLTAIAAARRRKKTA